MTVSLPPRYRDWADDIVAAVKEVAASDEFILKSRVAALEAALAERTGARHAVACANGTGALVLGLTALGVGPGDEVVTPAFSFISSASAIAHVGATPVFVDVDPETATIDPDGVEAAVTARTKAVLPVHLFSQVAPMPALRAVADRHGLALLEDSAVTLGGRVADRPAGRWGDIGVFSFFPAKPLGACGDAGLLITDDDELATVLRALRNHGQIERFRHDLLGFNSRMDEIVAGFLLRRLDHFDADRAARRRLADHYTRTLTGVRPLRPGPPEQAVYTYVVRATNRDGLRAHLSERGIPTAVTYPRVLPAQPVFADLGLRADDFPHAARLAQECLALPLYPQLTESDVDGVVAAVAEFYAGRS